MSIKYSIIIPTAFDKLESLLKRCLHSIKEQTDLSETEVIVVSNGATDNTEAYVQSLGQPFKLVAFPTAIGYSAAINAGIKESQGEFVVLLNNDTEIYPPKNVWMEVLAAPFSDPKVAITGPWKNYCPHAERDFLIFFVVMIRKSIFDTIGLLDVEGFGMGYGEDCDLCCKAVDAGFKIVQVPEEKKLDYDGRFATGNFPIYHEGNATFKNWPGGEQLLAHNREILEQRYGKTKKVKVTMNTDISKALNCDGFMSPEELTWLAEFAQTHKVIIEVGSWHGRSTRALADHLPKGGVLYAIDTWRGSLAEQETNHVSAKKLDGDHAYDEFCRNLWDHIQKGTVIPLRMHGRHAAKLLLDRGIKAQGIFIDGGHQFEEVQEDCKNFCPLLEKGGIICGHDYLQGLMPQVTPAVQGIFGAGNLGVGPNTTIWFTDNNPFYKESYPTVTRGTELAAEIRQQANGLTRDEREKLMKRADEIINERKSNIYDCFIFNRELDILEVRLSRLFDTVDRFVIVESPKTHSGQDKPLYFKDNLMRFQKYLHKITHIIFTDFPQIPINASVTDKAWAIERTQRDQILRGLTDCKPDDVIIISDLDEIPAIKAIQEYKPEEGVKSFEMELYYYNFNCKGQQKWCEAKIAPYRLVKEMTPCGIRYANTSPVIKDGGAHLTYFGGVDAVIQKISDFAHQEYNTDYFKNPERVKKCIENCQDLYERPTEKFIKV